MRLQTLLRDQTANVKDLFARMHQAVNRFDEIVEEARAVYERANVVLARYADEKPIQNTLILTNPIVI